MAKIRHIAIVVDDSEKTAEFYTKAFDLKEVFRARHEGTRGQFVIYLSDGYLNLALLPIEAPLGVHHFGFAVDDVEAGLQQALAAGAIAPDKALPTNDGRQAETFVHDPHLGIKLDISHGWLTEKQNGPAELDLLPAGTSG